MKFGYFSRRSLLSPFPKPLDWLVVVHAAGGHSRADNICRQNISTNTTDEPAIPKKFFDTASYNTIAEWLKNKPETDQWYLAVTASNCSCEDDDSRNLNHRDALISELRAIQPDAQFTVLTNNDIPIIPNVDFPDKVGIDRLLDACAAAWFYKSESPNITENTILVVDAGSAITIDEVKMINTNSDSAKELENINTTSPKKVLEIDRVFSDSSCREMFFVSFEGGAILAGLSAAADGLHRIAGKLPVIDFTLRKRERGGLEEHFDRPIYPAKNTEDAIMSGLLGGLIGAVNFFSDKVVAKITDKAAGGYAGENLHDAKSTSTIPIIITGGDAAIFEQYFKREFPLRYLISVPYLTLSGIAVTAFLQDDKDFSQEVKGR
ncbi:MAG: type III pantothenate kinase [Planctomycetaceae bacterium]|nr:type III pantothenate kinase [Planctomycetaceae bacterium]